SGRAVGGCAVPPAGDGLAARRGPHLPPGACPELTGVVATVAGVGRRGALHTRVGGHPRAPGWGSRALALLPTRGRRPATVRGTLPADGRGVRAVVDRG